MRTNSTWVTTAFAIVLSLSAAAGAQEGAAPRAPGTAGSVETPEIRTLSESEMRPYLSSLKGLVEAGVDAERQLGATTGDARRNAAAIQYSEVMQDVLAKNDLDPQSFSSIHWNVMAAVAAIEMEKQGGELAAAQKQQAAQLEAMKAQLSPSQYEQMKSALAGAQSMMQGWQDVPEANKALVRKHRAELDTILELAKRR